MDTVERGEVWWARIDEKRPVVLLSGGAGPEFQAVELVPPATAAQKRGFLVLSGTEALDVAARRRLIAAAGSTAAAIGVEVGLGADEGLADARVVRVALPRDGSIYCTWMLTLSKDCLIERIGVLPAAKLNELDNAIRLAAGSE